MKTRILLALTIFLVACSKTAKGVGTPESLATTGTTGAILPTATLPLLEITPTIPTVGELVNISSTGPGESDPFTVDEQEYLRVNWQQSCDGVFVLVIQNENPAKDGTPYGRVIFESTNGPGAGLSDYEFIPGQYRVVVEKADGPWKVWVDIVEPLN
jgi:hypothetical protein